MWFDSISGVRLDPELLSASRKVEIDFMSRLDVYRKRTKGIGRRTRVFTSSQRNGLTLTKEMPSDQSTDQYFARKSSNAGTRTMPGTLASMGWFE